MNPIELDFQEAKAKHLEFKSRLRSILYGEMLEDETPVVSQYECPVGKWLYNKALLEYNHIPELFELEKTHADIHLAARNLINLYKAGNIPDAWKGLVTMEKIADHLVNLLNIVEFKVTGEQKSTPANNKFFPDSKMAINLQELLQKNQALDDKIKEQSRALSEQDSFFKEILAASPTVLWMTDQEGNMNYMNPAWYALSGRSPEQPVNTGWLDAVAAVDRQRVQETFKTHFKSRKPFQAEFEMQPLKGDRRICLVTGKPVMSKDQKFTGFTGSIIDITDQKKAESDILRHTQGERQVLHDFFMQAPACFCILRGPNHVFELTNPGYKELIGNRDVIGMELRNALPEIAGQGFFELLDEVFNNRKTFVGNETPITLEKGAGPQLCFLNFIYQPIINQADETQGILVFAHEVTEQVLARQKTEESEQRFRNLIEQAPVPMCLYSGLEMKIEIANEALLSSWGKSRSVIGKTLAEAYPNIGLPLLQTLERVYRTGQPYSLKNAPFQLDRNNKTEQVYFDLWYNPIQNGSRETYGVLATGVDVTEKVMAQKNTEESEGRFRSMVQQAPVAIGLTVGKELIFDTINAPMLQMIDRTEAIIGKPFGEVLPELVEQDIYQVLRNVYEKGEPFKGFEMPVQMKLSGKSEQRYYNVSYTPLFENDAVSGILHVATDVTEQVLSRKEIESREQQLRSLVESAPFPIGVYHGREMRIQLANQAILDAWGRDDVIGKLYSDVLPELANQQIFQQLDDVYTTGIPFHAKNQRVDLVVDGKLQPFYFNYSFTPVLDSNGMIYGVMNTAADVTDLNVAKQKIEESEVRWRRLANIVPAYIFTASPDGIISFVSDKFLEFTGLSFENAIGEAFFETLHPQDAETNRFKWERAIKMQRSFENEVRWRRDDGEYRWVVVRAEPVKDNFGEVISWIGSGMDISELKTVQEELQKSEARFRLMADAMPQQIWTSTPEGDLNYFNQAVYEYTGLNFEQLNHGGWIGVVHPEEREENERHWLASIQSGNDFIYQHRFLGRDGYYRWQLSRAVPQRDADGNIRLWIGTSTDIHAQKTVSQQLETMVRDRTQELLEVNYDLERSNQELQQFAYIASHDLQEPLRKIITFSNRITDLYSDLPPGSEVYLDKINISAKRMSQLIHDLLDFSSTTRVSTGFQETSLNEIMLELLNDFELEIQNSKAMVELGDLPVIQAMPMQMTQLFHNLLSNALKFMHKGKEPLIQISARAVAGEQITDQVSAEKDTRYWEITFKDNGIGFDQKFSEQIFAIFQRLHGKSTYEGTGIGLALCRRIVDNHNGFIVAKSEENEGAEFHIYLPAQ
jgi:PAS domain S-box-containing protein